MNARVLLAVAAGAAALMVVRRRGAAPAAQGAAAEAWSGGGDVGYGMFAGRVDPLNPTGAVATALIDSTSGDPGIRLAHSRGKRTFKSGLLTPQVFVQPQGGVNSEEALDALPLSAGNRSRALGQAPRLLPPDLPTGAS